MAERTLFVMVKAPVAGAAKTRLAKSVGTIEALRFYRTATARLLRRVARDPRWRTVLAVTPDGRAGARFWPPGIPRLRQGGGDLGDRMRRLLETAARGPVVVVGSDIPGIRAGHVAEAFRLLGRHHVVVGPAEDGGYWLIGVRGRPVPRLFRDVRWSSEHALADTVRDVRGTIGRLAVLADVDTEADWRRWRRDSGALPGARLSGSG